MATRASKPVTVTLGELADAAQARVSTGRYASLSEVVRAGLRALDREEAALDDLIRVRIAAVNAAPVDRVALADGMAKLRARLSHPDAG
ncbi:type II toxin-antitoxin system ParD family antitoxin [Sandarakinorhabdus sp.]|uniref:ribbon-helix-helix domain-containing protein n=1 Tax=Sandarakinorhabdus sp. TaxID=1916663 RepID=UPI00333F464C